MYFYLRHDVTKINVIKANLNVIQTSLSYFLFMKKLPLRTRGTSVSRNFPGNRQDIRKNFNYSFSLLISNTKKTEKNLRKLLQGACDPKRVKARISVTLLVRLCCNFVDCYLIGTLKHFFCITNNFKLQPQQILSDDTIDKFSHQNPLN